MEMRKVMVDWSGPTGSHVPDVKFPSRPIHSRFKTTGTSMGKAHKGGSGKRKQRRHNPVRVPDNHLGPGVKVAEETSGKREQVIPVLDKVR